MKSRQKLENFSLFDFFVKLLNETKIFLTGFYKNEWNIPNDGNYLFELDHDGLLLQKTKLSLN